MYSKSEFIKNLLGDTTINYRRNWNRRKIVFDFMPEDFLKFAETALSQQNQAGSLVNALSNIKRAIDCQIELIISDHGLAKKAKKENWNFPKKIDFLKNKNVIAPRVLEKINKTRNLLEHEFKKPNTDTVEDAFDVATLFVGYCKQLHRVPDVINLGFDESSTNSFAISFEKDNFEFKVIDDETALFTLHETEKGFDRLLRMFYGTEPAKYMLVHINEIQDRNY